ncbi:MAG: flippase-like domain-containing protein [Deltaproteobacteria bacterium]|nr:flippase-like domain-containing protein [Deltaproteobacteria bacterium]
MKHKLFNGHFFLLLVGLSLIFFLCYKLGFENIYDSFQKVGFKFSIILIVAFLWHLCNTYAWSFLLGRKPSLWTLFKIKLKAETYNMITPFFSSGGEPLRIFYLKNFYSLKENISSVYLDKTLHIYSGIIFVGLGTFAASFYFKNPFHIRLLLIPISFVFISLSFFIFKNRGKVFFFINKLNSFLKIKWLEMYQEKFVELDSISSNFLQKRKKDFCISLFFHLLGWILGVFEIYLLLHFLGEPISFLAAFALGAFMIVVHTFSSFIPGSLGASEGSLFLLFTYVGFSPFLAVSFPLLRRLRMLCFTFIGVLIPVNPHSGS